MFVKDWPLQSEFDGLLDIGCVEWVEPIEQCSAIGKITESIVRGKWLGPKTEESQNARCEGYGGEINFREMHSQKDETDAPSHRKENQANTAVTVGLIAYPKNSGAEEDRRRV